VKKFLISLIAFLVGVIMTTNAQIINSGFENWTSGNPDGWATSNIFPAGLINIIQTSDNHSGSYALCGLVVKFGDVLVGPVVQSGPLATGFPVSERYHSFDLYYKFTGAGGDKFSVNVGLEKAGNHIAQGAVALPFNIPTYTHLIVPLTYNTSDVPDLAVIQISITGPVTGPDVHAGSVMFIDDLSFSLSTGIENIYTLDLNGKCFPNPASDIVNIPLNESVSGEIALNVFDVFGKEVMEMGGPSLQHDKNVIQLSVKELSSGMYFYSIHGKNGHYQGKFTVSRY
jgi:hypothetical protein